jgi:outer membrane autotransporter protein
MFGKISPLLALALVMGLVMGFARDGGIAWAADLSINASTTITTDPGVASPDQLEIIRGAVVNLNANLAITGAPASTQSLYILEGSTLNVGAGYSISAYGEVQIEGGPNGQDTTMILNNGASVTIPGTGLQEEGYFGLGTYYRNSSTGEGGHYLTSGYENRGNAILKISDSSTVNIDANQCFQIAANGQLIIGDNSNLNVVANRAWGGLSDVNGLFLMGEFYNFNDWIFYDGTNTPVIDEPMYGGRIVIGDNSELDITTETAIFGPGSSLEMSPTSVLDVHGELILFGGMSSATFGAPLTLATIKADELLLVSGNYEFQKPVIINDNAALHTSKVLFSEDFTSLGALEIESSYATLSPGKTLHVGLELAIVGSCYNGCRTYSDSIVSQLTMTQGSKIQWNGYYDPVPDEPGVCIGYSHSPGEWGVLEVNTAGGAPAEITGFFVHVENGQLILDENSTLNVNLYTTGAMNQHGFFITGGYNGDSQEAYNDLDPHDRYGNQIPPYTPSETTNYHHGEIIMKPNSSLNIDGRAYFSDNSMINLGLNTINITEDTWFKKGSTVIIERADTATGKINIGGLTTIEEGAKVNLLNAFSINSANNVILTSSGGFADTTVFTNPLFDLQIVGNDIVVDSYKGSSGVINKAAGGGGKSGNLDRVAALIDQELLSGSISVDTQERLIDNLETINSLKDAGQDKAAEVAIKQLIGEEALPALNSVVLTVRQTDVAVANRFSSLRANSLAPAAGYGSALNRAWASGFGSWSRQKDDDGLSGYRYNSGGVILGYDHEVESVPGLTLGVSGSFSRGTLKNNDHLAKTDINTIGVGLYGVYQATNGLFVEGSVGFGWSDNESKIRLTYINASKKSDFDSDNFQAGVNFGYIYNISDSLRLIPSVGFRYIHVKQDGWKEKIESDPDNRAVLNWFGDAKQNFAEIPISLKLESTHNVGSAVLTAGVHAGAVLTANDPKTKLRMGFVGSNNSVTLSGIDSGRNRLNAGADLRVQINDYLDLDFSYEFETRSKFKSHYGHVGLGISF